jgi:hypothetical protein
VCRALPLWAYYNFLALSIIDNVFITASTRLSAVIKPTLSKTIDATGEESFVACAAVSIAALKF